MRYTKDNKYEMQEYLAEKQNKKCPICNKKLDGEVDIHHADIHHAGIHNTKGNCKNYLLLLNNEKNLMLVHHKCHMENPSFGKISDLEALRLEDELFDNCEYKYNGGYEYACELDNKPCEKQCCKG